jgi:hypothetical protein
MWVSFQAVSCQPIPVHRFSQVAQPSASGVAVLAPVLPPELERGVRGEDAQAKEDGQQIRGQLPEDTFGPVCVAGGGRWDLRSASGSGWLCWPVGLGMSELVRRSLFEHAPTRRMPRDLLRRMLEYVDPDTGVEFGSGLRGRV